ncbi:NADH-quinone oxidoreductase subunit C [Desulfoscipio geothermicus]|uniref:NADH-quinone oxidoreductase subunit C n=1 Tax=Desulfoscipio geothermicus DSM 3669 TaxID=1121426 RepID=A0A1I6D6G3_9FIRM|nr:NADH-quinone oxidoreductase subunit C [Desulfoscipio geothermicus]SFR00993.1 NADH dehydrogenase subunit C [Desulfoscipio geothermicus DSM 3669]
MKEQLAPVDEMKQKFSYIEFDEQKTVNVPADKLLEFMQAMKDEYALDFLTNLTAVDYPEENKLQVVYNLNSIEKGYTLMVKTDVDREHPEVPSVFPVWGGANWQEREVYDLLGIVFTGHPNLKRILLDDKFEGHPLRKDFRWEGGRE